MKILKVFVHCGLAVLLTCAFTKITLYVARLPWRGAVEMLLSSFVVLWFVLRRRSR